MLRRKINTPESARFWAVVDAAVREVHTWPEYKLCGIHPLIPVRSMQDDVTRPEKGPVPPRGTQGLSDDG